MDLSNPAQVTNLMRRGLRFLFDPEPPAEEKRRCLEYFDGKCAYCDEPTDGRHDFDHLVSSGANHISNRVLSCKRCNQELKREHDWQEFLVDQWKDKDPQRAAMLKTRIEQWIALHTVDAPPEYLLSLWRQECERTTTAYKDAVRRIREAKQHHR